MRAPDVIRTKIGKYKNPLEDMVLTHATQKSKFFCKESDNVLLYLTNKLGYGNWQEIQKAVRREQRSRYDHLFISRNEDELKKRVIYLVQSLEKEEQEHLKGENTKHVLMQHETVQQQEELIKQMIERMKIEEENADAVYNGLVVGPSKPEPEAAAPAEIAPIDAMRELVAPSKQTTLQAVTAASGAIPDTAMYEPKVASQDTFKSIDDDIKKEPEDEVPNNDIDADMDEEEIGNDYDRQSQQKKEIEKKPV